MKRALDVLLSAVGLLLVAPFLLILAIVILVDSPGSPFFFQTRVGKEGRLFRIVKLRTMVLAPQGSDPQITANDDTRITRIGKRLRRHKLDELPQLWNVLRGDMSLVGPRPEVPRYVDLYPEDVRTLVLSVRPGITDPAAVYFFDEGAVLAQYSDAERAYREVVLPEKLAIYVRYIRSRTLGGDLRLIATTIAATVSRSNRGNRA